MGHFLPVIERRGLQHSVEVQKEDVGHGAYRHIGEVWRVHARCSARGQGRLCATSGASPCRSRARTRRRRRYAPTARDAAIRGICLIRRQRNSGPCPESQAGRGFPPFLGQLSINTHKKQTR